MDTFLLEAHDYIAKHNALDPIFIPTRSNWLNQVERFFARITTERIQRESFGSVAQLRQAILDYIARHNQVPKTFPVDRFGGSHPRQGPTLVQRTYLTGH